jgi:hypothetical protein
MTSKRETFRGKGTQSPLLNIVIDDHFRGVTNNRRMKDNPSLLKTWKECQSPAETTDSKDIVGDFPSTILVRSLSHLLGIAMHCLFRYAPGPIMTQRPDENICPDREWGSEYTNSVSSPVPTQHGNESSNTPRRCPLATHCES